MKRMKSLALFLSHKVFLPLSVYKRANVTADEVLFIKVMLPRVCRSSTMSISSLWLALAVESKLHLEPLYYARCDNNITEFLGLELFSRTSNF